MTKLSDDPRIDPRIKAAMGMLPPPQPQPDVANRAELMAEVSTPEAVAMMAMMEAGLAMLDNEDVAPSAGLEISTLEFSSEPDGNTVKILFIRPESETPLPLVYYIHGGGMQTMSAFNGLYRSWGRIIAQQGVAVAMVDFRNCLTPSSAPEVEPFPAGLNDCVAGLKYMIGSAEAHGVDPEHVIIAGESGGGNLTLASGLKLLQDGDIGLIRGLYALCPYIAGSWPQERFPSTIENNGLLLDLHNNRGEMAYGIEAFEAGNPLAWPSFATEDDVRGLPPTVISVNECDPLRDEGVDFYRLLLPRRRRRCAVSPGDGDDPRHRDLRDGLPRHQPEHRGRHGGVLQGHLTSGGPTMPHPTASIRRLENASYAAMLGTITSSVPSMSAHPAGESPAGEEPPGSRRIVGVVGEAFGQASFLPRRLDDEERKRDHADRGRDHAARSHRDRDHHEDHAAVDRMPCPPVGAVGPQFGSVERYRRRGEGATEKGGGEHDECDAEPEDDIGCVANPPRCLEVVASRQQDQRGEQERLHGDEGPSDCSFRHLLHRSTRPAESFRVGRSRECGCDHAAPA